MGKPVRLPANPLLDWARLLRLPNHATAIADAAGLENRKEIRGSVYELAQGEIARILLGACTANPAMPVVFLAHSLGCQVLSSYLYDAQKALAGGQVQAGHVAAVPGDVGARADQALRRCMQGVAAGGGVEGRQTGTRLHRARRDALAVELEPHRMRGRREGGGGVGFVAVFVVEHQVSGYAGMDLRRVRLDRVFRGRLRIHGTELTGIHLKIAVLI